MTKKEWLNESVFRDMYGRPMNLSDVPMTMMSRSEAFQKQGVSRKDITEFWEENKQNYTKESQMTNKKNVPFHIKHNMKKFKLKDGTSFWAKDKSDAKLYKQKVGE